VARWSSKHGCWSFDHIEHLFLICYAVNELGESILLQFDISIVLDPGSRQEDQINIKLAKVPLHLLNQVANGTPHSNILPLKLNKVLRVILKDALPDHESHLVFKRFHFKLLRAVLVVCWHPW
jgi:hypothetical protein